MILQIEVAKNNVGLGIGRIAVDRFFQGGKHGVILIGGREPANQDDLRRRQIVIQLDRRLQFLFAFIQVALLKSLRALSTSGYFDTGVVSAFGACVPMSPTPKGSADAEAAPNKP